MNDDGDGLHSRRSHAHIICTYVPMYLSRYDTYVGIYVFIIPSYHTYDTSVLSSQT